MNPEKPFFEDQLERNIGELLSSTSPHLTEECKLVIAEHAIDAFDQFFDLMGPEDRAKVIPFVKKHCDSSRVSLRNAA